MPTPSDFVRAALAAHGVPGCSIAVVAPSGVRWSAGFGWADLRRRRPADPETVYHLFSGTKLFTAVAVLQLVERGRLSLNDPVTRFFPELEALSEITVRDLLSHRSGLRDSLRGFLTVYTRADQRPSSAEALAGYRMRASRPPRQRVEYRNVNYALLGEIVTRVSGLEYVSYMTREVLEPLGTGARFGLTDEMRRRAATGYVRRFDATRLLLWYLLPGVRGRLYGERVGGLLELREFELATAAIGGLSGSVMDFARFLQTQLSDGGPVLHPESTRLMQSLVAEGAAGIESRFGVGLGWKIGRSGARTFLNHEGGGAGFTSELRIYPDARLAVALAMNAMQIPKTMRLAHAICEEIVSRMNELK
jgi:CubicO group peptidase (beta-lactamase class C family)